MFTGLIEDVGQITDIDPDGSGGLELEISTPELFANDSPDIGASIAVEGVCLTVVDVVANGFRTELSSETLDCTTLGSLEKASQVNLETSLKVGEELGGHFVSGHVDDVVRIDSLEPVGEGYDLVIDYPESFEPYIARKGSVALDGISLTINRVQHCKFSVRIISHTFQHTTLRNKRSGAKMNLEVDMLARYVEKSVDSRDSSDEIR